MQPKFVLGLGMSRLPDAKIRWTPVGDFSHALTVNTSILGINIGSFTCIAYSIAHFALHFYPKIGARRRWYILKGRANAYCYRARASVINHEESSLLLQARRKCVFNFLAL